MSARLNKLMQLMKLSAAPWPARRCRLMPAPARSDAGPVSQQIRSVGRTNTRTLDTRKS